MSKIDYKFEQQITLSTASRHLHLKEKGVYVAQDYQSAVAPPIPLSVGTSTCFVHS